MHRRTIIIAGYLLLSLPQIALAGPGDCREAADEYERAVTKASSAAERYARCVANSDGADKCDGVFDRLEKEQQEFKSAVEEIGKLCDRRDRDDGRRWRRG